MKISIKSFIPFLILPVLSLSGCFEITQNAQQSFNRFVNLCPLNGEKKYQISSFKNGKFVKSGIIRASNVLGGTCALKDLENVDFETSRTILEMNRSSFYIINSNVSLSFKKKEGNSNSAIIFSKTNKDGAISLYIDCNLKNPNSQKIIKNAQIEIKGNSCVINNSDQVQTIINSLDDFKPNYILTPL